jgi:RNA polymerase sigma factor (sigma-70 family)
MNGAESVKEFRERRSERAFAELVRAYGDLVFSVAKRRLNNEALAEEAAQSVFVRLARATPNISSEGALIGWLHRTTIHVATDLWRSESRRRAREEKAAAMQSMEANEGATSGLAMEIDEALNELGEADRQALLLRFFDGRKMRELGERLGISEDAAKMRVSRSLERLRERLALRGVRTTSILLVAFLTEEAVTAAPAVFAQTVLQSGIQLGLRSSWLGIVASALRWKVAAILVVTVAVVMFAGKPLQRLRTSPVANAIEKSATADTTAATRETDVDVAARKVELDPIKMLEVVARARNRISSGDIQYEVAVELNESDAHGASNTNFMRGRTVFDGGKRRVEQIGAEYRYNAMGEAAERDEKMIRQKRMPRAEALRSGLISEFQARYVSAFDGVSILEYRETDGKSSDTVIYDSRNGGHLAGQFDPRCLGLRAFTTTTVESALSLEAKGEFSLVGQETIDGMLAWHVRFQQYEFKRDYWISAAQPEHLLKHSEFGDVLVSHYAPDRPNDPLPIEVIEETKNYVKRFKRTSGFYRVPVDPATFTLAGIGMPIGTSVIDSRAQRQLGYWTGSGLSQERFSKNETESGGDYAPTLADELALLDLEPESPRGLDAAIWILLNTPDGAEVEKAGKTILDCHLQSTKLAALAARLESLRPRCAKEILIGMLDKSPDAETRATACFSLANTFMEEAEFGANPKATAEAKKYYQRILKQFSESGKNAFNRKMKSLRAIDEIDHKFIGHEAPAFTAMTTSGAQLGASKQSDHATLLLFRDFRFKHDADEFQQVFRKVADRNVKFVTMFCDKEALTGNVEEALEAKMPGWLMVRDGREIFDIFSAHSWPSTVLIDKQGIIRARNLRGKALEKAIIAAAK